MVKRCGHRETGLAIDWTTFLPGENEFPQRGKGLPSTDGTHGDLRAVVHIQIPPQLTPEEKVLWENLAVRIEIQLDGKPMSNPEVPSAFALVLFQPHPKRALQP